MLALAAPLALTATVGEARQPRAARRGQALPSPITSEGQTGGMVALRAPPPSEVRFPGGPFLMGVNAPEQGDVLKVCRRETPASGACDLAMGRESLLHGEEVTPEELLQNEQFAHQVTLSPFALDQREVSVGDYLRCVDAGTCTRPPFAQGALRFARPELPVTHVSWEDARVYCRWRGKRLPTEAEWERAARGLTARTYPWGNEYNRRLANHGQLGTGYLRRQILGADRAKVSFHEPDPRDGFVELAPVGSFPSGRTPDGIDDLGGNVAEWVSDLYEPHFDMTAVVDPTGPASSRSPWRVIRGGSYLHASPWLRATARLMAPPDERSSWIGFRCARSG